MKKLLVTLLLLGMLGLLGFAGCGEIEESEEVTSEIAATTAVPITAEAAILPLEYPASYRDAPVEYSPVLDEFYRHAQMIYVEDGEAHITGEGEYLIEPWFSNPNDLGYAIADINNDGISELLLLNLTNFGWGSFEEPFIHALFTLKDDVPVQLGQYWRRKHIQLAADGTIYLVAGHRDHLSSYKLYANATDLTKLTEYNDDGNANCFIGPWDGEQESIAEEEYIVLLKKYNNPPNPMKLNFIPIEQ